MALLERLNGVHRRAVQVNFSDDTSRLCAECNRDIVAVSHKKDGDKGIVVFFCGHVYHEDCLVEHEKISEGSGLRNTNPDARHRVRSSSARTPRRRLDSNGSHDFDENVLGPARKCFRCFDTTGLWSRTLNAF